MVMDFIKDWWYLVPTVMAVASIIARVTPNKTDDKYVAFVQKIIDAIAMSSAPTKLNKQNLEG